ncbi:hypothetical protein R1sor_023246 [Riccia sorocarpa]|uniref:Protein root UVB sensitive 5 n=1 Tax=Riccia sorocarpa TaxID=122646 RepID=A0ABD3GQF6_9MARC
MRKVRPGASCLLRYQVQFTSASAPAETTSSAAPVKVSGVRILTTEGRRHLNRSCFGWKTRYGNVKPSSLVCFHGPETSSVDKNSRDGIVEQKDEEVKANRPFAEEKFGGDRIRRYWLDEETGAVRVEEEQEDGAKGGKSRGKQILAGFIFPAGFPDSVSPDYLNYILWQFPTNVTGWICSTLVTSSLFKAVGIGDGAGTYAAAATATIKWVSKDGLGAVGQFIVGGRFGNIFDEDPKQWRMYADLIGSAGSIFELFTPLAPDQFLLLASLGHLTKAVAKGLKDPSFRVIQNHFAIQDNVGDVSAKEEVWEVGAKLVGLALAVVLLSWPALGLSTSYSKLVLTWISTRTLHLFLRHKSLSMVQLETINYKRASLLIRAHLQGHKPLPNLVECSEKEQLLVPWQLMSPQIKVGCSLQEILKLHSSARIQEILDIYAKEEYVLAFGGKEARVLLKEGASNISIVRSLWQAYWLFSNFSDSVSIHTEEETVSLRKSVDALHQNFPSFISELESSGWALSRIAIKVPKTSPVILHSSS